MTDDISKPYNVLDTTSNKKVSVMLAFTCNPYLAVLQKQTYLKFWKDEVDEVLVNVNGKNPEIGEFIANLWREDDKVAFVEYIPAEQRQGAAFNTLFHMVTGNVLVTLDSDNFVYKKGVIKKYSDMIFNEQYEVIGSKGNHIRPPQVAEIYCKKYGFCRYNPFMAFFRTKMIKHLDNHNFGTWGFRKGDRLSTTGEFSADGSMDVMAFLSIGILEKVGDKHLEIAENVPGDYMHISAMSSIFRRNFRALENTGIPLVNYVPRGGSIGYWVWFYLLYVL